MASTRLPPLPDELLDPKRKQEVIGFLRGMIVPGRYKAGFLKRWAELVGAKVTPEEFAAVRGRSRIET